LSLALLAAAAVAAAAPPPSLELAHRAFLAGRFEEACALYETLSKDRASSEAEEAAYLAAHCLIRLDAPEQAATRLQAFLGSYPQSSWADDALMDLAALDSADTVHQNLHSAAARYEYLVAHHPRSERLHEALLELGNTYVKLEEWKKAEQTFYQLLDRARTDEQQIRARLLIAALFSADLNPARDLPRALSEYEHPEHGILVRHSKSRQLPTAYFGHAEVRRKLHDFQKAIASYQVVVSRWPQHSLAPLAQSLIAYCHQEAARFEAARTQPETVKGLGPDGEGNPQLPLRNSAAALEPKDQQIQILSDNTSRQGEAVTEFSGSVRVFYAGIEIEAERARYDANERYVIIDGPARVHAGEQRISTQSVVRLDPERQILELAPDVQLEPPVALPACDGPQLHLSLRTGRLACAP
jgi:TolA-binding protein